MAKFSHPEKTLWCGGITNEVDRDILYELFLQAGPLDSVVIPKDKDGKQRTYAFITFKHDVSVPYAIDLLNGTFLFGSPIRVKNRSSSIENSPANRNDNFNDKNESRRGTKRHLSTDKSDYTSKRHKGDGDRSNYQTQVFDYNYQNQPRSGNWQQFSNSSDGNNFYLSNVQGHKGQGDTIRRNFNDFNTLPGQNSANFPFVPTWQQWQQPPHWPQ